MKKDEREIVYPISGKEAGYCQISQQFNLYKECNKER